MENVKTIATRIAANLPDDATWRQFIYRVVTSAKIAEGLKEIEDGKGISHEEMMKEMDAWLELSGRREPAGTTKVT